MELSFSGEIWFWRGPAPFHWVTVPADEAAQIGDVAAAVTYGWGCIPVRGRVGSTEFTTSLFPRDGGYIVPLKVAVRRAEGLDVGDAAQVTLYLDV